MQKLTLIGAISGRTLESKYVHTYGQLDTRSFFCHTVARHGYIQPAPSIQYVEKGNRRLSTPHLIPEHLSLMLLETIKTFVTRSKKRKELTVEIQPVPNIGGASTTITNRPPSPQSTANLGTGCVHAPAPISTPPHAGQ